MPRLAELAPREAVPRPAVAAKPRCPSCGGDLVTVKAHGLKGATALTCLVCFGRWLDGADLAKTRGRGLGGLLRSLLRALLPKDRPPPPPPPGPPPPPPQPPSEESARTEVPRQDQP